MAIITPGTIITGASSSNRTELHVVPHFNFSDGTVFGTISADLIAWKPTNELYQLTKIVAYGGSILPATPPAMNSSYQLNISAPQLCCEKANKSSLAVFSGMVSNWSEIIGARLEYLAWVSEEGAQQGASLDSYNISIDALPVALTDTSTLDPSELFIFAALGEGNDATTANLDSEGDTKGVVSNPLYALMSCKLQNATYALSFSFSNGGQDLSVQSVTPANDTFVNLVDEEYPESSTKWSYISVMMSYISVLIGHITQGDGTLLEDVNSTTILSTNLGKYIYSQGTSDPSNRTYQALPDIFQAKLEELFFNMTFSMLSDPRYL